MPTKATGSPSGERGAVSSAHPLASAAGIKVLKAGGNAVDAAVATSLALGVVAPAFSGLGGGGFFLVHLHHGETLFIDYREVAPGRSTPETFPLDEDGSPTGFANSMGHRAVGVPGSAAGLTYALENYGTMKFRDVAAHAIGYARKGFEVSGFLGHIVSNNVDNATTKFKRFPESGRTWLRDGGKRPYRAGELMRNEELARSLELLATEGSAAFYHGPLGRAVVEVLAGNGGLMEASDLERYRVEVRRPARTTYRGLEVLTMPPPSIGGVTAVELLNVFEDMDLGASGLNTPETIATMARAISVVWPPLRKRVADPAFLPCDLARLCSKDYAAKLWFGRGERGSSHAAAPGSQTTHLSVVDEERNVAAVTESIECYFGSGVVAPGTGFFLNDTMHDFDPRPGGPNSIAPGKRPVSNMMPTLLLRDGEPYLVAGSAAGPRIVTATVQTILNVVDHGLDVQAAVDAPRFHFQGAGSTVKVEGRIGARVRRRLGELGFETEVPNYVQLKPGFDAYFGGVHAILAGPRGELRAGADPRRQGSAAAY
ncbi:MAG: gamma-glutamyltransferase [Nitrososphaerales archaeon]|jgi:gamma-glutamyltranspeptidase/glutathione hydrolase